MEMEEIEGVPEPTIVARDPAPANIERGVK